MPEGDRYAWHPIEDLPDDWGDMVSTELEHLGSVWTEQSARLASTTALREFNERLAREWSIETGIIEGLYSIDRGTTQILIERGIEANFIEHGATDKPAELVVQIVSTHGEALEGLFSFVAGQRQLTTSYIKQLHQVITRFQDTVIGIDQFGNYVETELIRGDWKKLPNNPLRPDAYIHEYCPPEHVAAEMDHLIAMHHEHVAEGVAAEIEAAWLHHRFTQIHPFQDGNGRIARCLASLVFLRAHYFPLVVTRQHRSDYIAALEAADQGNLEPLVKMFVAIEKRSFLRALSLSQTVLDGYAPVRDVISSAAERLRARFQAQEEEKKAVFGFAERLKEVAHTQLDRLAQELTDSLTDINDAYRAWVDTSAAATDFWFKKQIVEVARELGYFADTQAYRSWVRMRIREERRTDIIVSLHSLGSQFSGVLVATAFLEHRQREDDDVVIVDGPHTLSPEAFNFSYYDDLERLEKRFREWLRDVALLGIEMWRREL